MSGGQKSYSRSPPRLGGKRFSPALPLSLNLQCNYYIITSIGGCPVKVHVVPIGNSKGVRIPKTFLEMCHIGKEVEMSLEGDTIFLRPIRRKPRQDWDKKLN